MTKNETSDPEKRDAFKRALRAFDRMTVYERWLVLETFARLAYPSITDRLTESVHRVITRHEAKESPLWRA